MVASLQQKQFGSGPNAAGIGLASCRLAQGMVKRSQARRL